MNTTIESQLREFIIKNLLFVDDDHLLTDNDSLLANGVVDSIGIMELVEFVSTQFGLEVSVKDINQENFDSIARLANYIRRRQSEREGWDQAETSVAEVAQPALRTTT